MTFRKSIYEPLHQRLLSERRQIVRLTFSEMEEILRRKLPASAHKFTAWWSNESSMKVGHTQARAWMNAGFRAHASIISRHRIPPGLIKLYGLALVEGLRALE
ncbi:DUF7662 domain-containing protein [Bradyrhizobium sp. CCBAU 11386]|uniref:DUF7662 domain-containing protein n=1 Tax=Bradyrhizobium sp. CCBAU 11386 TaxID=1630837 RepID=UPI003FA44E60